MASRTEVEQYAPRARQVQLQYSSLPGLRYGSTTCSPAITAAYALLDKATERLRLAKEFQA